MHGFAVWLRIVGLASLLVSLRAFDTPVIGEDPRAPVQVDAMLMCESCLAIVDHVMTSLKKKGTVKNMEIAVSDLLDDACDQDNMKRFKFIPPKMVKGCQAFKDEYDGQFEEPLFKTDLAEIEPLTRETRDYRPGLDALQDKVCVQTISACKGVTVNPPRIERPKVNNGGPQVRTADDIDDEQEKERARAAAEKAKKKAGKKKKGKKKKGKKKPVKDL